VSDTVLKTESLSFGVDDSCILDGITFSAQAGERLSIIGPNGAGKSTLLRCLSGVYKSWQGEVSVFGGSIRSCSSKALARTISYVPQVAEGSVPYTVREFVLMGRYPHLSPFSSVRKNDIEVVEKAMECTGVLDFSDRLLGTLSGGERQKVYIAASMAQEARIMLFDEPSTFLDPKHQAEVLSILVDLNRKQGRTIITVTHDINTALHYSHRIIGIKEGKIVFDGDPSRLAAGRESERIYDISFDCVAHPDSGKPVLLPKSQL